MFIYDHNMEKVELDLLPSSLEVDRGTPLVSVTGRETASVIADRVTRASRTFLGMGESGKVVRSRDSAPSGVPPAVFEERKTGLIRMVHAEVVMRFQPGTSERTQNKILKSQGLRVRQRNAFVNDQVIVYDPEGRQKGGDLVEVANRCAVLDEVLFATPNFISEYRRSALPVVSAAQWHLNNMGAVPGQVTGEDVRANEAWAITQGKRSIIVAILDDGVDVDHPSLRRNIKRRPDRDEPRDVWGRDFFIPDDEHPSHFDPRPKLFQFPYDQMTGNDIHGTPCAGIVAAAGKYGEVLGIAPNCRLLAVKIFHADSIAADARVADAIRYAALHADILSCSWSGPVSPDIELAIRDAGTLGRRGKGAAVFCASGNDGRPWISYPAAYPEAIAIGASTDQGGLAPYSNVGPEQWLVAPSSGGVQGIYTTDVSNPGRGFNIGVDQAGGTDGLHTNSFGGTSAATPLAAGVGALVLSVKGSLTRDELKQVLADTADKIGNGYDANGHSRHFGYGRVNAARAVEYASSL